MKRHPSRPDPAGILRAFQMAAHLPTRERVKLQVNVLASDGRVLAGGTLRGFEQAGFLRDQLQVLGFFEYLSDAAARQHGCDLLLKQEAAPRAAGDAAGRKP